MNVFEVYCKQHLDQPLDQISNQALNGLLVQFVKDQMQAKPVNESKKKLYYFSAEFLIGKLLSCNLINLGLYQQVEDYLQAHGRSMMEVEEAEIEPSLGNGGLGRLAACFLDSIASLGLNGDGIGLNYHFGLFRQVFENLEQKALPDAWISDVSWLEKSDKTYQVNFKDFSLQSSLYEIDVVGYQQETKNRLRLFDLDSVSSEIIKTDSINFDKENILENLTLFLYPDDSDRPGNLLRIYQQYYMVSNGAQLIIDEALEKGCQLVDLPDYAVVQINDTHPALVIPELIRLLHKVHGLGFNQAVKIVEEMTAYTNHTILAEALEKWPLADLQEIVPEVAEIIISLDQWIKESYPEESLAIIDSQNRVHMAHLAIHFGYSINGVAALHTQILEETELKQFKEIYPDKFNNKTNGITFRRWIMAANQDLARFLDDKIGLAWRTSHDLRALADFKGHQEVRTALEAIKQVNKHKLNLHLQHKMGLSIKEDSIIDVQIKRIHEYKRQQMLALYIIYKYLAIKSGQIPSRPITILFGGKAANAYTIARDIIHLILSLSKLIAEDPVVSPHLQVVMVENYNVTSAQYLIPAADISEQISLASKEASGTGNMKFMLNGALTLCTMDGANVEIAELVGPDNIYVFGKSSDEIVELYQNEAYKPSDYYQDSMIKPLVDFIVGPELMALGNQERLNRLHQDMIHKDYFMALIDLKEFIAIKEKVYQDFEDRSTWMDKVIVNISQAGFFSSDRTISQYNQDIWQLDA